MMTNNIFAYRKKRELTQRELARLMGISPSAISAYENGLVRPDLNRLLRLALALNCSVEALYWPMVKQLQAETGSQRKKPNALQRKISSVTIQDNDK